MTGAKRPSSAQPVGRSRKLTTTARKRLNDVPESDENGGGEEHHKKVHTSQKMSC